MACGRGRSRLGSLVALATRTSLVVIALQSLPWLGAQRVAAQSTYPTLPPSSSCAGLSACEADTTGCGRCLTALSNHSWPNHLQTGHTQRDANRAFFYTATTSPSCPQSGNVTAAMEAALYDAAYGDCHLLFGRGELEEYRCIQSPDCRECLGGIWSSGGNGASIWSAACNATNQTLLSLLATTTYGVPACTLYKGRCGTQCRGCVDALAAGDAAAATAGCNTGDAAAQVDNVVFTCINNAPQGCSYWEDRCSSDARCLRCLQAIGYGATASGVVDGMNSPACANADTIMYLRSYVYICPNSNVPMCPAQIYLCMEYSETCRACMNQSGIYSQAVCDAVLQRYDVKASCAPCPESVFAINRIVLATSIVGGVSMVGCLTVMLVIVAYSKDRAAVRERSMLSLFLFNMVYSSANIIPVNRLQTDLSLCGDLDLPFSTIRFGRAWWFFGKYGLVMSELLILGTSVWVLTRGVRSLPPRIEAALHGLCLVGAFIAFAVFYTLCQAINRDGYNEQTQTESKGNVIAYLSFADDGNDDVSSAPAQDRFESARLRYDSLLQVMLLAYMGFLGVAIVLWIFLRWQFSRLVEAWRHRVVDAEKEWARDLWDPQSQGVLRTRQMLLLMAKEAYEEVAKPLEPFVFIFVLFGIPAAVMASSYCEKHSGAQVGDQQDNTDGTFYLSYGLCDVWCELILAFRSLATVLLYFSWRENRQQLWAGRTLLRRLGGRLLGCVPGRRSGRVRFRDTGLEERHVFTRPDSIATVTAVDTPGSDDFQTPYQEWSDDSRPDTSLLQ
eukprot:m.86004 g.86004  ORF g.86004 m.86004 type:complete len:786 (+) comp11433_c0_seq1:411-2768(+)